MTATISRGGGAVAIQLDTICHYHPLGVHVTGVSRGGSAASTELMCKSKGGVPTWRRLDGANRGVQWTLLLYS